MMPILSLAAAMPALGQAKTVVRLFHEYLTKRVLIETGGKQAERPASQMRLARAEVEVGEAELLLRNMIEDVCAKRNTRNTGKTAPAGRLSWLWLWTSVNVLFKAYAKRAVRIPISWTVHSNVPGAM